MSERERLLSYVVDSLTVLLEQREDRRLHEARELVLDVAMRPRRRWRRWMGRIRR